MGLVVSIIIDCLNLSAYSNRRSGSPRLPQSEQAGCNRLTQIRQPPRNPGWFPVFEEAMAGLGEELAGAHAKRDAADEDHPIQG